MRERVLVWPADRGGCGHYRLIFVAQALIKQGAAVEIGTGPNVLWRGHPEEHVNLPPADNEVIGLAEVPDADVVVFQRPARRWWADLVPHLQAAGIKVVVDVDDRFDRIRIDSIAYKWLGERGKRLDLGYEHVDRACKAADLVTASTKALAERYGYGHGVVLPNLVPEFYFKITSPKDHHSIGWSGTLETHGGDLQVMEGTMRTVLHDSDWHFTVIGPPDGIGSALKLEPHTYIGSTGWVPFEQYPFYLAQLEVGIVPLFDGVFNASKSSLKFSELSSLGIPTVASPTPDNVRLHNLGVGVLASSPSQWARKLRALTLNERYRLELGESSREAMKTQCYESQSDRWWQAWTR